MKNLLTILALVLFSTVVQAAPNIPAKNKGAHVQSTTQFSSNWSGYAMKGASVSDIKGTWVVPAAVSSTFAGATYSSTWVGIDGWGSNTVEQLGTESDYNNITHTSQTYCWYEMYPNYGYYITLPNSQYLSVGDVITAEVKYISGGWFELSMVNSTKRWYFYTYQRSPQAQRVSAEWIVEAPWMNGVLPLADFVVNNFTGCSATVGGSTPVGLHALPVFPVEMVGNTDVKAFPSLPMSGDGFSDFWLNNF